MNHPILLILLLGLPVAAACIQPLDTGAAAGDSNSTNPPPLPSTQCVTGSKECFDLCGAPSCALPDASIPPNLDTPVIYLSNGKTVANPCDAVEAESMAIRQRSCAQCHGPLPAPGFDAFNFVLDDAKLVTSSSNNYTNDAGLKRLVIPGDPANSWFYQRIVAIGSAQMPPANPSGLIGPKAGATVITPSAQDISVLYGWIQNCVGQDGGGYANYGGGGPYGPDPARVDGASTASSQGDAGTGVALGFATDVYPILSANCVGCHSAASALNLSVSGADAFSKLVGQPAPAGTPCASSTEKLVVAGNSTMSIVYSKVSAATPVCGARMPMGQLPLSTKDQTMIKNWIDQGANP